MINPGVLIPCLAWALNGMTLAAGPAKAAPAPREPQLVATLEKNRDRILHLAFSPDGASLFVKGHDQSVLWDVAAKKPTVIADPPFLPASFTPDGKFIFMEILGRNASLYEVATGKRLAIESDPRVGFCYSADGLSLVKFGVDSATMHRLAKPFDPASGEKAHTLDVPAPMTVMGDFVNISPFTLKGDLLAVKGKDRNLQLWQVETGKRIAVLPKSQGLWYTFSPDGRSLAAECGEFKQSFASPSGVKDPSITLFDAGTGRQRGSLVIDPDDPPIKFVTFSPDSRLVVSASNYTIKAWNAATGRLVAAMEKPKQTANPVVSIRKDGRMIAGLAGGAVHVWNANTGKLLHLIDGCTAPPVFSPDGTTLVTGHQKGEVRIYRLP